MALRDGICTMSRDGRQQATAAARPQRRQRRHGYYYAVLPNLLLSPHPDYVMTHALWPLAPISPNLCEWHFHPKEQANPRSTPPT